MSTTHGFRIGMNPMVDEDDDEGPDLPLSEAEPAGVTDEWPSPTGLKPSQTVLSAPASPGQEEVAGRASGESALVASDQAAHEGVREAPGDHRLADAPPVKDAGMGRVERTPTPLPASLKRRKTSALPRFELNERHREVFEWLDFARYSSREQVAIMLDQPLRRTGKILDKLILHGYLGRKKYPGYPTAYYLTPWAKSEIESETAPVDPETGPGFVRHTLAIGWVALGLIKRESPLTELVETLLGRPATLEDFVSEAQFGVALREKREEAVADLIERDRRVNKTGFVPRPSDADIRSWLHHEVMRGSDKPDRGSRLYRALAIGVKDRPHVPDLLLVSHDGHRRTSSDRPPLALAFEVERSVKPKSLAYMMDAYRPEANLNLAGCVWVTGDDAVFRRVASYFPSPESFAEGLNAQFARARAHLESEAEVKRLAASLLAKQDLSKRLPTTGDAFTQVVRASDDTSWSGAYLARLEERARADAAKDRQARTMGAWHVKASGQAEPCHCGVKCLAKHGRFRTETEARRKVERLQ